MDLGDRKVVTSKTTNGVVVAAGSVWEGRMKVDQVKGGIKVFNGDDDINNPQEIVEQNTSTTTSTTSTSTNTNTEIQVYKRMPPKQGLVGKRKTWKTENSKNGVDQKTPIQIARKRSELAKNLDGKELSVSVKKSSPIKVADGIKKTPRKSRSGGVNEECSSSINGIDRNVHKEVMDESSDIANEVLDSRGIKKSPSTGVAKIGSCVDDNCEDKVIMSDLGSGSQVQSSPAKLLPTYDKNEDDFVEESVGDVLEEIEKTSFDVKEVSSSVTEHKAKKVVIEENKIQQGNVKSAPISLVVKKQRPPVVNNPSILSKNRKSKRVPFAYEFHRAPKKHSKLQSLVDLVMWRDVSRSAFIFGLGTFIIISSSYTTDINISLITVLAYMGLVYLAAIFLFRSIICRGAIKEDDTRQEHVVGEEEAIWLLKLALPYLNEFLLNLGALFSGDPATTMKLAVLLFVLARCGSSITIWKMAKLGFFGVFTVPKVCSSYSSQLTAFGIFWIQHFKDSWESCSYKKSVGFFIFTVMWNLSSIIARIWAVFMLFVAFKYYQQQYSLMNEEDCAVEEEATGESVNVKMGVHTRQGPRRGPILNEIKKQNKGS